MLVADSGFFQLVTTIFNATPEWAKAYNRRGISTTVEFLDPPLGMTQHKRNKASPRTTSNTQNPWYVSVSQ